MWLPGQNFQFILVRNKIFLAEYYIAGMYLMMVGLVLACFRHERWRGFFKGIVTHIVHVTPSICLVFLVYEKMSCHNEDIPNKASDKNSTKKESQGNPQSERPNVDLKVSS